MFSAATFDVSNTAIASAQKKAGRGQARHMDEDELMLFFQHLPDEKWQAVFALAYFTGSRISEVLSLDVSAVQSDRVVITILKSKSKRVREIAITPGLKTVLRCLRHADRGLSIPSLSKLTA